MHQLRAQHFVLGTVQYKYGNTEKYLKIFSVLKSLKLVFLRALYFCGSMLSNLLVMSFLKTKAKDLFWRLVATLTLKRKCCWVILTWQTNIYATFKLFFSSVEEKLLKPNYLGIQETAFLTEVCLCCSRVT